MVGGTVEAIACGPELDASVSIAFVDEQVPTEDEDRSADKHAVCAHGHCHHAQQAAVPTTIEQFISVSQHDLLSNDAFLPDNASEGLRRPPRA